jgi:pyridinium-3,5-biscarboxylic acid mononucleotide synthase
VNAAALLSVMRSVAAGTATPEEALQRLAWLPVETVAADAAGGAPFARIDHHRSIRNGFPEVVYCEGKTAAQVVAICERLGARDGGFLATRADAPTRAALATAFPAAICHDSARIVHLPAEPALPRQPRLGSVLVASAGTADAPVAEEAVVTARALGNDVDVLHDVGVAGLHRLLDSGDALGRAAVIIVVAGMEGALASVLGGLVRGPVIAVPTSVGYGASFGGVAALLAMLNSCAAGVTVVNIDNGFGAACAATRILQLSGSGP